MEVRPVPRYSYERRQRLHRAMTLRRRLHMRRAGMVAASVLTVVVSLSAVAMVSRLIDRQPVAPLFVVDDGAVSDAAQQATAAAAAMDHAAVDPQITGALPIPAVRPRTLPHADPLPAPTPVKYFGQRAVRPVRTMRMLVTAYCPGPCCCGEHADGKTASGKSVFTNAGHLVAADTRLLPFNSLLTIPGYDHAGVVPVLDRGGKIKGHRLDVLFPTHAEAKKWGARWIDVTVWEYVE